MTNYRKSLIEAYQEVLERELTPKELKDREKIAKKLPIKDFEKRYGKEKGMQVKMATATNMAKAKSNESFDLSELSTQDALVVRAKQLSQKKNGLKARIEIANKIEIKSPSLFKYYRELEKKGDKNSPAVKKFDKQLMSALAKKFGQDTAKKTEKALKEELNEDGHTDVPSAIRKCKTMIEDANEIMSKLNTMGMEDSLPSWWTNKLAIASNSMNKLRDYILNPIQENVIQEAPGDLEDMKKIVGELEKASKMHLGQSKRVAAHIGMMEGESK